MSMPLRAGYKRTEAGVIPQDWSVSKISDLKAVVTSGSRGWAAYYSEHGSPFIRITNLSRACIYPDLKDLRYVNVAITDSEAARTKLCDGDVLISITADIGIVGFVTEKLPKPSYINQHIALVRFDAAETDSRFVSYFLASENSQKLFRSMTDSGAKAGMNLTTVKQIQIALPPTKAEQEAIAEALNDVDVLIESLEQLITKKCDLKQGAMQELLSGRTRLQEFNGKWEIRCLGEVAEIRDGTHQTPKYVQSGIPFFSVENVTRGDFANTKFISEEEHRLLTKYFRIEKGDVLMTRIGSIGDCKLIDWDVDASFYVSLALLKFRKGYSPAFITHFSKSEYFKKEVELNSLQSAIPKKINLGPISNVKINIPINLEEQEAISATLSDMDAEIAELEAELAKARTIKQGMMNNLLTGKIRLI